MYSQSNKKKKRNVKPSAFMTFLMEFKHAQAKKGKFLDMKSAQEAAGILWNVKLLISFVIMIPKYFFLESR